MVEKRVDIKIFNEPSFERDVHRKESQTLTESIKDLLQRYEFIENGGIDSICLGLIYNKPLNARNPITYENGIRLIFHRYPSHSVSSEQSVKHSVFRANLDTLLRSYQPLRSVGVESLNVVLFFNQKFEDIKIDGLDNSRNEEGLAFFTATKPRYRLEQIVLNESLRLEIQKSLLVLSQRDLIYSDWGFAEIDPEPRAILNFFGPSGTGKTMTAHAVAHSLSSKILALNYAEIESKFVGDAPKNLVRAFETASRENAVLFFDEADSFLGKRIVNVSTSSDQAVNSLRSQMLILLENFDGIVIFATNLVTNYDRAFESRIFKHIKFDLPDFDARKKIISKTIPSKVPFEYGECLPDEIVDNLSIISDGFSGREIKNAVLDSLITALSEDRRYVKASDFELSFAKQNKSKETLAEENKKSTLSISSRKRELEEKIQNSLQKISLEAIIEIAIHAAFSDGVLDIEEREAIEKMAKALDIPFRSPSLVEEITPLNELLLKIDSNNKAIETIEVISHIIAANGIYSDEEKRFMANICSTLKLSDEISEGINTFIFKLIEANHSLSSVKQSLFLP